MSEHRRKRLLRTIELQVKVQEGCEMGSAIREAADLSSRLNVPVFLERRGDRGGDVIHINPGDEAKQVFDTWIRRKRYETDH